VARFAAITTQEAGLDTRSMKDVDPVKMIELMGRNSGWIVAASAILKKKEEDPPHLLLLPEVPFDEIFFLKRVEAIYKKIGYCIVVLSETIRDSQGRRIGALKEGVTKDPFGHVYVEGAAKHLCRLVENHLKVRARFDKPGTIQRMSIPYVSDVDQREAYQAGVHAVKWAVKGISGVMVGFARMKGETYRISYLPVPLEKIPNRERYLPPHFLTTDRTMVTAAFQKYALPLIGSGLPSYPLFKQRKAV
jgi:6-phosphofructokinase 1